MSDDSTPYMSMIQDCEAAITRIRAAIRSGNWNTSAVGDDFMAIRTAVAPRLARFARSVRHLSPGAEDEALEAMFDQLLDHIRSLTYVSLETQFGAYLKHMPLRVVQKIQRKYRPPDVSLTLVRLDAVGDENVHEMHETVADPRAETMLAAFAEHEDLNDAIRELTPEERLVINLRLQGFENSAIAQHLTVSPASATRIYQRAVAHMRRRLDYSEE